MPKINWDNVYVDRLKQIETDLKLAIYAKKWDKVKELRREKNELEKLV